MANKITRGLNDGSLISKDSLSKSTTSLHEIHGKEEKKNCYVKFYNQAKNKMEV